MIHDFLQKEDEVKEILKEIIELTKIDGKNTKLLINKEAKKGLKLLGGYHDRKR